ncbi:MAG: zeta toxin [Bacteroidetes bacterium 46-16]|nr:MAG: zeta toxin [Bacteroidetes bacterium 46-16]
MPTLYIIAGPNGAGKTTASYSLLPDMLDCKEYVNADEIARGISPFNPEGVAIEAGRIMLQRIDELIEDNENFAFETTLSTRSYVHTVKRCKKKGYNITLVFFWLSSPELARERVLLRVSRGGHNIPPDVISRRYDKGIKNLLTLFIPICDYWIVADNSHANRMMVAEGTGPDDVTVFDAAIWEKIKLYGA